MLRKPTTSPAARLRAQVRRLEKRTAIAITGAASYIHVHTQEGADAPAEAPLG